MKLIMRTYYLYVIYVKLKSPTAQTLLLIQICRGEPLKVQTLDIHR